MLLNSVEVLRKWGKENVIPASAVTSFETGMVTACVDETNTHRPSARQGDEDLDSSVPVSVRREKSGFWP